MKNMHFPGNRESWLEGEFYFKATLDMAIYKEIGQLLLRYQFK